MADHEIDFSELAGKGAAATEKLTSLARLAPVVQVVQLTGVEGPAVGVQARSSGERFSIGSDASNDLVVADPAASRYHCEIVVGPRGVWLRDLGSRNGTVLDGVPIIEAGVREGSLIQLGRSTLRLHLGEEGGPIRWSRGYCNYFLSDAKTRFLLDAKFLPRESKEGIQKQGRQGGNQRTYEKRNEEL